MYWFLVLGKKCRMAESMHVGDVGHCKKNAISLWLPGCWGGGIPPPWPRQAGNPNCCCSATAVTRDHVTSVNGRVGSVRPHRRMCIRSPQRFPTHPYVDRGRHRNSDASPPCPVPRSRPDQHTGLPPVQRGRRRHGGPALAGPRHASAVRSVPNWHTPCPPGTAGPQPGGPARG